MPERFPQIVPGKFWLGITPEQFGQLPGAYRWVDPPPQDPQATEKGSASRSKPRGEPEGAIRPIAEDGGQKPDEAPPVPEQQVEEPQPE